MLRDRLRLWQANVKAGKSSRYRNPTIASRSTSDTRDPPTKLHSSAWPIYRRSKKTNAYRSALVQYRRRMYSQAAVDIEALRPFPSSCDMLMKALGDHLFVDCPNLAHANRANNGIHGCSSIVSVPPPPYTSKVEPLQSPSVMNFSGKSNAALRSSGSPTQVFSGNESQVFGLLILRIPESAPTLLRRLAAESSHSVKADDEMEIDIQDMVYFAYPATAAGLNRQVIVIDGAFAPQRKRQSILYGKVRQISLDDRLVVKILSRAAVISQSDGWIQAFGRPSQNYKALAPFDTLPMISSSTTPLL